MDLVVSFNKKDRCVSMRRSYFLSLEFSSAFRIYIHSFNGATVSVKVVIKLRTCECLRVTRHFLLQVTPQRSCVPGGWSWDHSTHLLGTITPSSLHLRFVSFLWLTSEKIDFLIQ